MRTMAILVGCILLLQPVHADGPDPAEEIEERAEEILGLVDGGSGGIVEGILGFVLNVGGASLGSSVTLTDTYIDDAYHEELASGKTASKGDASSIRTTPHGFGSSGEVLFFGTGGGCRGYYHDGDEDFTVEV